MYNYGPLHMAEQKLGDQLEHTYSSSVQIRGVALRICRKRWTIGRCGEKVSGISVPMARQDDHDFSTTPFDHLKKTLLVPTLLVYGIFFYQFPPPPGFFDGLYNVYFLPYKLYCHWCNSLKRSDRNKGSFF